MSTENTTSPAVPHRQCNFYTLPSISRWLHRTQSSWIVPFKHSGLSDSNSTTNRMSSVFHFLIHQIKLNDIDDQRTHWSVFLERVRWRRLPLKLRHKSSTTVAISSDRTGAKSPTFASAAGECVCGRSHKCQVLLGNKIKYHNHSLKLPRNWRLSESAHDPADSSCCHTCTARDESIFEGWELGGEKHI